MEPSLQATDADLYRLIVEGAEDYAIFALDEASRIRTWNRGAEKLLGYRPAEVLGRTTDVIFTPEDRAAGAPEQEVAEALATGRADDDRWHVRKDGSRFWASGVMTRLDDGAGGVRGLVKILRDQTALKLAEEERDQAEQALRASELRLRRLIEANIVGVGIGSSAGAWVDANDELLRILGRSRDDLRAGRVRWDEMTPEEFRPLDRRGMEEAEAHGACTPYEKEFALADGSRVPVFLGYAQVSGVEGHYVCFVVDLRPQKRVEQALREADRRKDEFLAMLAHELRNPLAPIRTSLYLLKHPKAGPEVVAKARETMERQVDVLVRLVDDLLDVSRIMRGKVELRVEPIDLLAVIARAVETSRPLIDAQAHDLSVVMPPGPVPVVGDPVRLAQVFSNLLNNAAKYTEKGGRIDLGVAIEGHAARVTIRDTGVGIPPDRLAHIFDLFVQVDPTLARSQGGLGIGLTLVKQLVEMHGGSVEASSDGRGRGSEFAVRLPLAAAIEPAGATPTPPGADGHALKILVVDDNVDAASTLALMLEAQGHAVAVAHSPSAAIDGLAARPDLILLDIGLPGMSGYDVAREIRRRHPVGAPIMAAITGYGQEQDRERAREAGFDFHLVKPVDPERLVTLIANLGPRAPGRPPVDGHRPTDG